MCLLRFIESVMMMVMMAGLEELQRSRQIAIHCRVSRCHGYIACMSLPLNLKMVEETHLSQIKVC